MQLNGRRLIPLIVLISAGCGNVDPKAQDTETDSVPDGDAGANDDYYPMAVGDYWTYRETEGTSTVEFTYTVTGTDTIDFGEYTGDQTIKTGKRKVFIVDNTFASQSSDTVTEEGRTQYIEDQGDRVVRHQQDIYDAEGNFTKQRNFYPGFLRFDRTKISQGDSWSETITRVSDPRDGSKPTEEEVTYDYEVLDTAAVLDLDSKTYICIEIKRTFQADGETKYYWYAKGIGKVQELTGDKIEQLIDGSYL